ncbi:EamA family transporter [Alcaligenaceae bacterium]|nr:EamA family transporter [Alcaligenaceae bacterium]
MTLQTFLLVVIAAGLHATWNLISKRAASAGTSFVFSYRLLSVVVYAPWVVYILWNDGMAWSWPVVLFISLSSALHLGYSICLMRGYKLADLSVVYPIARGTGPLLASAGAFLWLAEAPSTLGVLGICSVVAGILLIATQGNWRQFAHPQAWVGVRWGLLIGLFIAAYSLTDAYSVKVLLVAPVMLDWLSALGGTLLLAPSTWMRRTHMVQQMRGKWGLALAVGVLSPLAYILVLYALQNGANVSVVAPLREMSMMMATFAGFFILKEKVSPVRWLGCFVIIAGVILLSGH